MQTRPFGRSGLKLSVLGFGCGAVGGLMVRGTAADQERAVARAIAAGINYFDNRRAIWRRPVRNQPWSRDQDAEAARHHDRHKVRLRNTSGIREAITASLDDSLQRLGLRRSISFTCTMRLRRVATMQH